MKRRRIADDKQHRQEALPELREVSRQEYLKKREEQRILLAERELEDELFLFKDEELTKKERKELEYKRQVLQLAKERMSINDHVDGYQMPEDYITEKGKLDKKKQDQLLYGRYREEEGPPVNEQQQWEAEQIKKSTLAVGAKGKRRVDEDYEFIFDEEQQMQFVLENTLQGKQEDGAALLVDEEKKKGKCRKGNRERCLELTTSFISSHDDAGSPTVPPNVPLSRTAAERNRAIPGDDYRRRNRIG